MESDTQSHSQELERAFEQYREAMRSDIPPAAEEFVARYPAAIRNELRTSIEAWCQVEAGFSSEGAALEPGSVVGDYRLVRELGRGGHGFVWEAVELTLPRPVALKILRPSHWLLSSALERFQREAEAYAKLRHPSIVKVYQYGASDGLYWIAQELIPGGRTLSHLLEQEGQNPTPPKQYYRSTAEIFAQVADALAHAHANRIIHRDVKPSNILLEDNKHPKLTDFGLARSEGNLDLSSSGELLGTRLYMSPEQLSHERDDVDHRSDIFGFGATLYEALTLEKAFHGRSEDEINNLIKVHDPLPPHKRKQRIPRDLSVICMKCLEKHPKNRYQTMQEVSEDLRRYLTDIPIQAKPRGPLSRSLKWTRRHPVPAVSALAATVLLAVGLVSYTSVQSSNAQLMNLFHTVKSIFDFSSLADRAASTSTFSTEEFVRHRSTYINANPPSDPLVDGRLRAIFAQMHLDTGWAEGAILHSKEAVALLTNQLGERHPEALAAMVQLGAALLLEEDLEQAVETLIVADTYATQALSPQHATRTAARRGLVEALHAAGRADEAQRYAADFLMVCAQEGLQGTELHATALMVNALVAGPEESDCLSSRCGCYRESRLGVGFLFGSRSSSAAIRAAALCRRVRQLSLSI